MTLEEAEADRRFEQFKFCDFMTLLLYINKCNTYMRRHPEDKEVQEMLDGANLIKESRMGNK